MLDNMPLRTKLVIAFLLVGILPFTVIGLTSLIKADSVITKQATDHLIAVRAIKQTQIEDYFGQLQVALRLLKDDTYVAEALVGFNSAYQANGKSITGSAWHDMAAKYESRLKNVTQNNKWYDLFLINTDGAVLYTVAKEPDLGQQLMNGPLKEEGLGKAFQKAKAMGPDEIAFADFAPYSPSKGEPAAFMMAQIFSHGQLLGYVAFQLPMEQIGTIMNRRDGMGQTGETYLVGPDKLMRSDSFLEPKNHTVKASFANPAKGQVDTIASREALSGKTAFKIVIDYNGNPVLSAYAPVKVGDVTWALLAEIDEAEAFAAVRQLKWLNGVVALVGLILIVGVALLISSSITKPLRRIIAEQGNSSDQIAMAAGQVSTASQDLAGSASEQASALEETSASMEELTSMTRQNADNSDQADALMKQSCATIGSTNSAMAEMDRSMNEISSASEETFKIIKTIDEIAFQTNLLALNAAVEAARAGEAGAGFAVVADEVRNLAMRATEAAKNTAQLIEDTVRKVNSGKSIVAKVTGAFQEVTESSTKVGSLLGEISAASKEQAQGIGLINQAITQMDAVTQQNAASSEESAAASAELSAQAESMLGIVMTLQALVEGGQQAGSNH